MFVCPSCGVSAPGPTFCTEDGTPLVDAADDALLGTPIGPYRLARRLGRGGMGAVYLGVHSSIGSRVAVKVLLPVAAETPTLVERFFAEARAVNVIRHESIVNVLDLDVLPDGRPYIVMECLDGQPLSAYLTRWQPFPIDVLIRIAIEVLGALEAAHTAGITHRDLKPDNVFVTTLGRAKVLDFGIAKLRPEQGGLSDATRTGTLLGTPHYMSPEQAASQPVDHRSDLYSLGVILFQGATGRCPFDGTSLYELLHQHLHEPPPSPGASRPDLPPELEAIILRALAKHRDQRFQSAREMGEALVAVLRGVPASGSLPAFAPIFSSAPPPGSASTPSASAARTPFELAQKGPTPPTIGAVSSTLSALSQRKAPRGGTMGIVVGGFAALIALAALGVALIGVYFAFAGRSGDPSGTPAARGAPPSATSGPAANPKGFDPIGYIPEATKRARTQLADAELTGILVVGLDRDGTVDIEDLRKNLSYSFRSPSASAGTGPRKCLMSITVNKNGKFESVQESDTCRDAPLPKLRCSLAQIAARGSTSEIATMSVQAVNGQAVWQVAYANGTFAQVRDDC